MDQHWQRCLWHVEICIQLPTPRTPILDNLTVLSSSLRPLQISMLSFLIEHINAAAVDCPIAFLSAVEDFCTRHWLKVAGGAKAHLVERGLLWPSLAGVIVEFGAFVGYSTARLARHCPLTSGTRFVTSFEVDPAHCHVVRHFLTSVGLSGLAEVLTGLVHNIVPSALEMFGHCSVMGTFADHRGTAFHQDLSQLSRLGLHHANSAVVADNVLKPGAPELLWRLQFRGANARSHEVGIATTWSLPEFLEEHARVEDWTLIERFGGCSEDFAWFARVE